MGPLDDNLNFGEVQPNLWKPGRCSQWPQVAPEWPLEAGGAPSRSFQGGPTRDPMEGTLNKASCR